MTSPSSVPVVLPERPYPGIESFHYVDHPIFFGREQESEKLLRYVTVYRGVLLYGVSGAGKSSLVNAGFIPKVMAEGFAPERIRVQPRRGEEIIVERIPKTGGSEPEYLDSSFAEEGGGGDSRIVLSIDEFRSRLRRIEKTHYPLLIFDQFEEFISLFEEAPGGDALRIAREVQQAILNLLLGLTRDSSLRVKLLYVFREDYLAKLGKLFVHCPNLPDTYLRLTSLRAKSLNNIIRGPFDEFPGRFERELSPELAEDLASAIRKKSEFSGLNLSEVQIACLRLWESREPEQEFKQKGVRGLLEDYLSDSLQRLPQDLFDPAVGLLSRMVTEGGLRNVISQDDLVSRVEQEDRIPNDKLKAALIALEEQTRLIRRERRHDIIFYEIVSEFLVPWIAAQKAERKARQERRIAAGQAKAQRQKWMVATAVLLVIAAASGIAAYWVIEYRTAAALQTDLVIEAQAVQQKAKASEQAALKAKDAADEARRRAEDTIQKAEAALQAAKTRHSEEITDLQGQITKQTQDGEILSRRITDRDQRIGVLTRERDSLDEQLTQSVQRTDELNRKITDLRRDNTAMQGELEEATRAAGTLKRNPKDGLEYGWIPPGTFQMGCTPGDSACHDDREKPRHKVTITKGFWIGQTEVTVAAYQKFALETGQAMPAAPDFNADWQHQDHPVVNVTWRDAQAFCKWQGGRLPTEAEWEYAARGGREGLIYPWGNQITHDDANYSGYSGIGDRDQSRSTVPVGSYPATGFALYDMGGNVFEWVADWHDTWYYRKSPDTDPRGPGRKRDREKRGGSWYGSPDSLRASGRSWFRPVLRSNFIGFRCAREVSP